MSTPCWYTLVLRYNTYKFYLAPRASIFVEESTDLESFSGSGSGSGGGGDCATCGQELDRTWTVKLRFLGGCDMVSAWALFRRLEAFLTAGCSAGDFTIERTVCGETPLVYKIKKAKARMVDVVSQRVGAPRLLSIEITFELTAWVTAGEGAVLVGA